VIDIMTRNRTVSKQGVDGISNTFVGGSLPTGVLIRVSTEKEKYSCYTIIF
jgi:hypothetical protein